MNGYSFTVYVIIQYLFISVTNGQDIDECSSNPCLNGGTCTDSVNDFSCQCRNGFSSKTCASAALGASCTEAGTTCTDSNAYCYNVCVCRSSYYDSDGTGNVGGKCELKHPLGNRCPTPTSAVPKTATCLDTLATCAFDGTLYICKCPDSHYDDNGSNIGGSCITKVDFGFPGCSTSVLDSCKSPNAQCNSNGGFCTCKTGYYDNNGSGVNGGTCVAKVELGGIGCSTSVQDSCKEANAECLTDRGYCLCKAGYYDDNGSTYRGTCRGKQLLDNRCPTPTTAVPKTSTCLDSVATCELDKGVYICKCPDSHYDSDGSGGSVGSCTQKVPLGSACPQQDACVESNSMCSSGKECICKSTHYDSNGVNSPGGTCTAKVPLGSACPQQDACVESNSMCSSGKECVCQSTHYDSNGVNSPGGTCTAKVGLGYSCPMPDACSSSRAECVGSTSSTVCKCKDNYYDDNTDSNIGGQCQDSKSLGQQCINSNPFNREQCTDSNAQCTYIGSNYYCSCNAMYHKEGSVCVANKALGDTCTGDAGECSNPNAECLDSKCTCKVGFYRYSTGDSGGVCQNVEQLQVTGIAFSGIQTSQFTVSWTPPAGDKARYINSYTIEWRPMGSSANDGSRDITTYSPQTIKGLIAGRAYEVEVISKNTATQPGTARVTSARKTQAAKPGKTSGIDFPNSDRDIDSGRIKVAWFAPSGYLSSYKVRLLDGPTEVATASATSTSTFLSHSGLKNGYRYVVTIQAYSQNYDNGKTVPGDTYSAEFETTPTSPQQPKIVSIGDNQATSITVSWNIAGPRPGKTSYEIKLTADQPAEDIVIFIEGFNNRSVAVTGLQEYWNYQVQVTASTSVGSSSSNKQSIRTQPAAPGKVANFKVIEALGGIYTFIKLYWLAPQILERNGVIKEYSFIHNAEGKSATTQTLTHEPLDDYVYSVVVNVIPEETYTFKVYATNEQNMKGEITTIVKEAPAGVPVNVEDTLQVNVISSPKTVDKTPGKFTVTIVREFFEESTNGRIQATGLLACAKDCDFSSIKTISDFKTIRNWKQASLNGFPLYRVTYPTWLLDLQDQSCSCERKKRAVSSLEYTLGGDDCTHVSPNEFCNGPLSPGTEVVLVAVSCTNGGCLLSNEYGPFSTASAPESIVTERNCTTQSVVIGVILGLIIVVLFLYAGYVTLLNRRYRANIDGSEMNKGRKRDSKGPMYVNESFMVGAAEAAKCPINPALKRDSETEYSRLDDNTRDDKETYDIIQAI